MAWLTHLLSIVNQGNLVNKRLSEYSTIGLETLVLCFDGFNNAKSQKHNPDRWINAVSSCIEQGNLSSAVRLVCSPEGLAESSPATFDKLCSIHPKIPVDRRVFPALTPTAGCVSPAEVLRAVKSFKNGSSGGLDGLRPQHLKDVFLGPLPIDDTLNSLTQFINLILSGACPLSLSELEFALGRVSCLSAHDALTIIRNALSLPKLMYFLRTSKHIDPSKLGEFDGALRTALSSICNVQEPSGISAHDGRRPDGCTLIPWRAGRCLAWDVTVPGTLAERYVNLTSKECGLAAARAADEKMKKYGNALPSMEFLPICIEVLGPMDPNTLKFLKEIGKMISVRSDFEGLFSYFFSLGFLQFFIGLNTTKLTTKQHKEIVMANHRVVVRTMWYRRKRLHTRFMTFVFFCFCLGFSGPVVMILSVQRNDVINQINSRLEQQNLTFMKKLLLFVHITLLSSYNIKASKTQMIYDQCGVDSDKVASKLNDFKKSYQLLEESKGGGVGLYMKKSMNFKLRDDVLTSLVDANGSEYLCIELSLDSAIRNILLLIIYRSPTSNVKCF
ncbi:hypothetical protein HELRODRAFT_184064 [Helobdella robusta]|uniref:Uncharacterized protein n=1 Tax=Helobdella robusta TaxID=6412 RepID=T1FKI6_HELRO|nr:hypothetical protein HELRODRAFT_184064 [Helobdella robusta]ESO08304.1 hypothetical protein HELRODRAFT_184064 [Helobdella robusta]